MKSLSLILLFVIIAAMFDGCTLRSPSERDALRALVTVNTMIERSNDMIDHKNERMIKLIYAEKKVQPEKVQEAINIIKQLQVKSNNIHTYIEGLIEELYKSDDLSIVNRVLANGKDGEVLLNRLEEYKKAIDTLMSKYPLPYKIPIDLTPPTISGEYRGQKISWEFDFFHNIPKIAAITILDQFDNDVKNTQAMCIDRLAKEVVSTDIVVDRFEPIVSAKSTYVHVGDKYEALIGLGAFNSAVPPQISVDGKQIEFKDGQALYTVKANTPGTFRVPIIVKLDKRGTGYEEIQGELQYTVGR